MDTRRTGSPRTGRGDRPGFWDAVYVRSAYGYENPWFQRALASGLDDAYHAKYDRHGPKVVGTVVSAEAAQSTLRLVPRD